MRRRGILLTALLVLLLLHHDFWNWDDATLYLSLPVGLAFHLLLCLAASALFTLLVFGKKGSGKDW